MRSRATQHDSIKAITWKVPPIYAYIMIKHTNTLDIFIISNIALNKILVNYLNIHLTIQVILFKSLNYKNFQFDTSILKLRSIELLVLTTLIRG